MGCWNGTCMISNLPIFYGDDVKMVILYSPYSKVVDVLGSDGYCYSHGLLRPSFYPITGIYNDYGSIENVNKDWSYEFIDGFLKKSYSGMVADGKSVEVNLENFIKGIERGGMKFTTKKGNVLINSPYSSVMIRKDIWDGIIETQQGRKVYWNDKREKTGQVTDYYIDSITYVDRKLDRVREAMTMTDDLQRLIKYSMSDMFYGHETHMNVECLYPWFLFENILTDENVKKDYFELIVIQTFLEHVRKGWIIQPGKGSQDGDTQVYRDLNKLIEMSCEKIENRFGRDDEDFE